MKAFMNLKWKQSVGAAMLSLTLLTGCSERWIEADAGLSGDEVIQLIADVQANQGAGVNSSARDTFNQLVESPTSYIYFVDGPSPMGTAFSAASLVNFNLLGRSDVSDLDLAKATVVYVEDLTEQGWKSALLVQIEIKGESQPITRIFESIRAPRVENDLYVAEMGVGGNHQLTLKSLYVEGDELQTVIQFDVYEIQSAQETWVGKFGAMVGFGG